MCHACNTSLGDPEIVKNTYRIENVATQPAERITANDEERQRQGFELQTTFEWAIRDHALDVRRGVAADSNTEVARLAYGTGATITRLNKGLRRRKNRTEHGFMMDPVSGYWAKNEGEGEELSDPSASPRQRIVPCVQDRKNALLLQPSDAELSQRTLTTIQHALLRGIESVFQLEEGEILAEPMPQRDSRTGFLFYEATEGGAGVLTRLVAEPQRLAEVARQALVIMHFDLSNGLPGNERVLVDESGTSCVAACYRCLMSYFNQPDHELIDRRDSGARSLLLRLANSRVTLLATTTRRSSRPAPAMQPDVAGDNAMSAWITFAKGHELPDPDREPLNVIGRTVPLVWRSHYVVALFENDDLVSEPLTNKGFEVIVLGKDASGWREPTLALARSLGRST
jgi:hypothetical protein